MQLSLIFGIGFGFWSILDLPISEWPGFRHFRFSVYPGFHVSGVGVNLDFDLAEAGWIEDLFEVVALKSQFSDPKWNCLVDSLANSYLWKFVLPSYLARNVTAQFHVTLELRHGIQIWPHTSSFKSTFAGILWILASQELEYCSSCGSGPVMN